MTYRVSTTEAQAAVMEQVAAKFEQGNSSIQSMLSSLLANLEPLQTKWAGAGGRSFTQVKLAWQEDMDRINRALSETASAVRSSGQHYTSTDEAAQSRVNAVHHGGQTLPL